MKRTLLPPALLLRTLPNVVHTELISRISNHLLKGQWMAEQLIDLEGKRLCIEISDTNTELLFAVRDNKLQRCSGADRSWDVRIKGDLEGFWLLATRQEDPDTLFFNRQLALEGETEAGLYLKNMLDALEFDWEAHLEAVMGARAGGRIASLLHRTGIDRRLPGYSA
ncbi:hypothetical protein BOW53_12620 [Solemya pervernicosa gill symbiont]|uniref:SCP2 domain-containing protein n=2 Tax=Gammaproteobacteria incertae sedis TaxID=118884 RepID=A0A1T2L2G4_9GAMM|nr:SCP2 sterol-binding domain-containing protein [Candidatus Reidiella endopervernicosa]OOZ39220.1 hypothetical protein BOW53_12620 [Solemya pervernicosa gill symbiont]QKQ28067.1 SCP2 sterol-binding domain-containing protein [Candidatus Reidiella endopervernicosa]